MESWIQVDLGLSLGSGRREEGAKGLRSFARERLLGVILMRIQELLR